MCCKWAKRLSEGRFDGRLQLSGRKRPLRRRHGDPLSSTGDVIDIGAYYSVLLLIAGKGFAWSLDMAGRVSFPGVALVTGAGGSGISLSMRVLYCTP